MTWGQHVSNTIKIIGIKQLNITLGGNWCQIENNKIVEKIFYNIKPKTQNIYFEGDTVE